VHASVQPRKHFSGDFNAFNHGRGVHYHIGLATNLIDSEEEITINFLRVASPIDLSKLVTHTGEIVLLFALLLNQVIEMAQLFNVLLLLSFETEKGNHEEHDGETDHITNTDGNNEG